MFVPPLLLVASSTLGFTSLAFTVLILVAPFLRGIFGDEGQEELDWTEEQATFLEWLPLVAAVVYVGAASIALWQLLEYRYKPFDLVGLGASLWSVFLFASCVAHELLHRRSLLSRSIGRVLSGVIGYPILEHEHSAHHRSSGNVELAECPGHDETVWQFLPRRCARVVRAALEGDAAAAAKRGHGLAGGLPVSAVATVATASACLVAAGVTGLALYLVVAALVGFTLQVITYVQHWGLGERSASRAIGDNHGWDDHCRLQAWLTLGISYHHAHHTSTAVPYYRRKPARAAPTAPFGYGVLLFASMFPSTWRALMEPSLQRWKSAPQNQQSGKGKLICLAR